MAPVLPFLSDRPEQLRETVRAVAAAGATSVTPLVLHLRPGAREWYMAWLARRHPHLVRRYETMYGDGAYAPTWYQRQVTRQVHEFAAECGMGPARPTSPRTDPPPSATPQKTPTQLTLS